MTKNPYAYAAWAVQTAKHWEASSLKAVEDLNHLNENVAQASRILELSVKDSIAAKLNWLAAVRSILEQCE